jgi:hypothetical protein
MGQYSGWNPPFSGIGTGREPDEVKVSRPVRRAAGG